MQLTKVSGLGNINNFVIVNSIKHVFCASAYFINLVQTIKLQLINSTQYTCTKW